MGVEHAHERLTCASKMEKSRHLGPCFKEDSRRQSNADRPELAILDGHVLKQVEFELVVDDGALPLVPDLPFLRKDEGCHEGMFRVDSSVVARWPLHPQGSVTEGPTRVPCTRADARILERHVYGEPAGVKIMVGTEIK